MIENQRNTKNTLVVVEGYNGMHNISTRIREIIVDDFSIRDEYEISNVMNDYFPNVGENL